MAAITGLVRHDGTGSGTIDVHHPSTVHEGDRNGPAVESERDNDTCSPDGTLRGYDRGGSRN